MSIADLQHICHTLRLAVDSQNYCGITPFYGSPTLFCLTKGVHFSVSPAMWQQFIKHMFENIPNRETCKIIVDDVMIFSIQQGHFEDLANLFKALIIFGLKILPHV